MENHTQVDLFIAIALFGMFAFVITLIIFYLINRTDVVKTEKEKQIAAYKATVEAEEKQKVRIARNLHDELIPLLSVIAQNIEKHVLDYRAGRLDAENLNKERLLVYQSIESARAISLEIIPGTLMNNGLISALGSYVENLDTDNVPVEFDNTTSFKTDLPFTKSEETNIYRLCLEIINNLQKHDHYNYLKVMLSNTGEDFLITVVHDGNGVTNEAIDAFTRSSSGLGLKSIKSRLLILNAQINYSIETDCAKIALKIPFSHE